MESMLAINKKSGTECNVQIETNCAFEHNGMVFESGGAFVSPEVVTAYLDKDGILTDWHGNEIGRYRITRTWRVYGSCISSSMSQVYAKVNGIWYTGRSAGVGMIFNGKRVKKQ